MPDPTRVWEVDLLRGRLQDRGGLLRLEVDALVFVADEGPAERTIPLPSIARVRRLRMSPVLMVRHAAGGTPLETAYYFTEPPRLRPVEVSPVRPLSSGKRQRRRQGVVTLVGANRGLRSSLRTWERELRDAIRALAAEG